MDYQNVWTVATKDFSILRVKKSIIYTIIAFPLGMAIGLAAVIWLVVTYRNVPFLTLIPVLNAFAFWFMIMVSARVIVSARVTDIRTANQFGALLVMPFAALYVLGEIDVVPLTANNLLIISAVLLLVDVFLFFLSKSTFRREEILTKWK